MYSEKIIEYLESLNTITSLVKNDIYGILFRKTCYDVATSDPEAVINKLQLLYIEDSSDHLIFTSKDREWVVCLRPTYKYKKNLPSNIGTVTFGDLT